MTAPLDYGLQDVLMTRECPRCGRGLRKKGSWFRVMGQYTCPSCQHSVPLTYSEKVLLFAQYSHLSKSSRSPR